MDYMRRVALATGVELAVHTHGDGVPVLLLHAWAETHRTFDLLVPLLPGTMRLVVPDLRGVGESSKPATGYSLREAAEDVRALLDALGIETCWVVGTSSGGYLAQQVAVDHPGRVRGLVLIGAPSDLRGTLPAPFLEQLSVLHDPVTVEDVRAVTATLPLHRPVPEGFLEDQTTAALTIPKHVWRESFYGLVGALAPTQQGVITVPTLVLWGAEDDVLPTSQANDLATAIPHCRVVAYAGTGHLVLWEQPERVALDMAEFIATTGR